MTIKRLSKHFYESDQFCTYPTDMLDNCSKWPVVIMLNGKLHSLKTITYAHKAMVLVASDTVWNHKRRLKEN